MDYEKIQGMLAFFGLLLLIQVGYSLFDNLKPDNKSGTSLTGGFNRIVNSHKLPNIYHLVLDGYQTEFFDMQLADPLEKSLSGFNYYHNTSSLYDTTTWSVPSIFLGEGHLKSESDLSYYHRAFNGEQSFLNDLKKAGYKTIAVTRKFYPFNFDLFDQTVVHSQYAKKLSIDNNKAFFTLWIYRVFPNVFIQYLASNDIIIELETYENIKSGTFLADSAPQESMASYLNFLSNERSLPAHSRYTYIHLMLPHSPYVYDGQCKETPNSSVQEQSQCATSLLVKLIEELKRLNRYEQSLIIVNSDHGSPYRKDGQNWIKSKEGRSHRSLLLVKPAKQADVDTFKKFDFAISLIDIAAGIKKFSSILSHPADDLPFWRLNINEQLPYRDRIFYKVYPTKQIMKEYFVNGDLELDYRKTIKFNSSNLKEYDDTPASVFPVNMIIEAEKGLLSSSTEIGKKIPGTHGNYVTFGNKIFRFELLEDAEIEIKIRAIAPNGNSDSTYLRINDTPRMIWFLKNGKTWQWHKTKKSWHLEKGIHTIIFEYREPIYIDQLEIISQPI